MHTVSSAEVVERLEKFCDLSACPKPWACATLLTNADIKADITLLCNIICKQKSCSFNTLTRVGAHALHGGKLKDLGE